MSESVNTRMLVLETLLEMEKEGTYSHIALRALLDKYMYLPLQERRFMTRLFEGTIERRLELDYIINQFSKTKTRKMKAPIRLILEMGAYQLKYMDSVPDSAACNEAVKLAVKKGFGGLKGFVNGVMRSMSRGLGDVKYPDSKKEPVKYLSVRYSMPEWIVERLMADTDWKQVDQNLAVETQKKPSAEAMLEAFLVEAPTSIRVNTARISPEQLIDQLQKQGIQVEDTSLEYAKKISGYSSLMEIPEFADGLFYVQDFSSMQVAEYAKPEKDSLVVDVCAAPGGKSTHIAELMKNTGKVIARDLTEYKVSLIEENIAKSGLNNLLAQQWDARELDSSLIDQADLVIADLPCSGLGVLGRKTDIKYHTSPESVTELASLQREILTVVQEYVKAGGKLVYSTCTITREENQLNADWFAKQYTDFELLSQVQMWPEAGKQDGFFIAVFKRH